MREAETKALSRGGGAAASRSFALLIVTSSGTEIVSLPERASVTLGRDATSDVAVVDDSVSRRHAVLYLSGSIAIEDVGSRNGTSVDGQALVVGERTPLSIGQTVELGSATVVLQGARGLLARERVDRAPVAARAGDRSVATSAIATPIVADPTMKRLYAMIDVIAPTDLSVLVLGETGSGKEVFAETLHRTSRRRAAAFLRLNCAALPESTLEGELFGWERGAFTGAVQAKAGLFESADGGTVFLDELGDMPLGTQAKLLRLLESGEVMRLGSLKPKHVDIRLVSATHRDLQRRIGEGIFRADLYFRINGITLTLPPLRSRPSDILPLAEHFAARAAAKHGRATPTIAPSASDRLESYRWPGNVRELRNVMERAVVLAGDGSIEISHLGIEADISARGDEAGSPSDAAEAEAPRSLRDDRNDAERRRIVEALEQSGGHQAKAAEILGIARRTLLYKLKSYGITRQKTGYR
ncbi:MAG: sigma 54-interacting transcriptional regulator [Polyangiales bacterium]